MARQGFDPAEIRKQSDERTRDVMRRVIEQSGLPDHQQQRLLSEVGAALTELTEAGFASLPMLEPVGRFLSPPCALHRST
jgi:hypothetical protein